VAGDTGPLFDGAPDVVADAQAADAAMADAGAADGLRQSLCQPRRCGVEVGCGEADDGCGGKLACGACVSVVKALALDVEHVLFDRARDRLYATVASAASMHANSLLVIDPRSLDIVHDLPVGTDPRALALSPDGKTLWVGVDGPKSLRLVDLTTTPPTVGPLRPLPALESRVESSPAEAIAVLPGRPGSAVVVMNESDGLAAVLDDGVARSQIAGGFLRIIPGPDDLFFGYNAHNTGFELFTLTVDPAGIQVRNRAVPLLKGFETDIVYTAGRVYASSGHVIDVSDPLQPWPAGRFSFEGAVIPRSGGRVTMVSPRDSWARAENTTLRRLDAKSFTQIAAVEFPAIPSEAIRDIWLVAPDTVVFLAIDSFYRRPGPLYLIKHGLVSE
jgi:hypothetical protein